MTNNPTPPSILLIIADDLAWGDLSRHGNAFVETPRLDGLADAGVSLTRYCSGPLCTPARASLMTGRYPYRTRAIDTYLGRSMLDPEEVTLAQWLRDAGYRTGAFGKWHLGDCYPMRACDRGFEQSLVHAGGGLRQPGNPTLNNGYFDPDLALNGERVKTSGYCTDLFTDAAIEFIDREDDRPFFTFLATNAPHTPMEVADEWIQPHRQPGVPEKWARLYGMVANLDWNVGRVLDALKRRGQADNTLVIFTSDHGPCGSANHEGQTRYNADLRGIKGRMYEGGIRVPCFWGWPGHLPAGIEVDRLSNPIDIMPTLAGLCGISLPDGPRMDGVNLQPLLESRIEPDNWPERDVFMQWHRGDEPVRYRSAAVIGQRLKLYMHGDEKPAELFDLSQDPMEQHDLSQAQPQTVERLRERYDLWFDDVSATRPDNYAPPRIIIGSPHQRCVPLTRQDWRTLTGEGWSDDDEGYWLVHVEQPGPYRVLAEFPPLLRPGRLHLHLGKVELEAELLAKGRCYVFSDVSLVPGDARIKAWLTESDARRGVRQVDVLLKA